MLRSHTDQWLAPILAGVAIVTGAMLLLIVFFLVRESMPVITQIGWLRFITDPNWYPLENLFGIIPMLWASLAASIGAICIAAPLGVALGIFQVFYATPAIARFFQLAIALLAGIPSVVFGLWGLTVLVPIIAAWQPPGTSLLAGIVILALMILPTVALTCASALTAVPVTWLHAANALGMSTTGKVLGVALPAARQGIISGVLLAIARALGETMAVLMVAGNVVQTPGSVFDSVRVLTANIALEMAYASGSHRSALFVCGLILTALVLLLAVLALRQGQQKAYA